MKEAFEKVNVVKIKNVRKEGAKSIRERWWRYPLFLGKIVKGSRPLSYILLFAGMGVLLCLYLTSPLFLDVLKTKQEDSFTEGSVGAISSFNPLFLTQNAIDKSIEELVFEKFIEIDRDGNPQPGIAVKWESSNDGLTYTFDISLDHLWQDGEPLTADDVVFTFETGIKLADKYGEDSVGVSLTGIEVSKVDEDTVKFVLEDTNATFFEAVSIYIVPKHKLEDIDLDDMKFSMFGQYPLGSGPYKVVSTEPNIVTLEASEYYEDIPSIKKFVYRIYEDMDSLEVAFRNGDLDAISGIDSGDMDFVKEYSGYRVLETDIDQRTKMIFFNLRRDSLDEGVIRQALSYITDKEKLLELSDIPGTPASGPIPSSSWAFNDEAEQYSYNPEKASELFKDAGYIRSEDSSYYESQDNTILSFTISYLKNNSNDRLLNSLKDLWEEEGVILNLNPLSYEQITQEVIATRNFELLMYEVETTIDPDQYNLWHSLKVDYPNLNLSGYEYERVDILLEDARVELTKKDRIDYYDLFQEYLMRDVPALFLYHPKYVYVVPEGLNGPDLSNISFPEERFQNISEWSF